MDLAPKTELAIKIIGLLNARHYAVSKMIAESINVSDYQVRKVCTKMVKAGILEGREGPRGGYSIKNQPTIIELLTIFEPGSFSQPDFDSENPAESALYMAKCDLLVALHNIHI